MHKFLLFLLFSHNTVYVYISNYTKSVDQNEYYRFMLTSTIHEILIIPSKKTISRQKNRVIINTISIFKPNYNGYNKCRLRLISLIKNVKERFYKDKELNCFYMKLVNILAQKKNFKKHCFYKLSKLPYFESNRCKIKYCFVKSLVDYLMEDVDNTFKVLDVYVYLFTCIHVVKYFDANEKSNRNNSLNIKTQERVYNIKLIKTSKGGVGLRREIQESMLNAEKNDKYIINLRFYFFNLYKYYLIYNEHINNHSIYILCVYINNTLNICTPYIQDHTIDMIKKIDINLSLGIYIQYFNFENISNTYLNGIYRILAETQDVFDYSMELYKQIKLSEIELSEKIRRISGLRKKISDFYQDLFSNGY